MKNLLVSAILLVVPISSVMADSWTDVSGKFTVDAEFVGLKDGVVTLRRKSNKVINIPMAKLSEESRRLAKKLLEERTKEVEPVAEMSPKQPSPADVVNALASKVKVSANAELRLVKHVTRDGKESPYTKLLVHLDFVGAPAKDATEMGFLTLDSASVNGKPIKRYEQPIFDVGNHFREIGSFECKHLDDGCRLTTEFRTGPVAGPVAVAGSMKLRRAAFRKLPAARLCRSNQYIVFG